MAKRSKYTVEVTSLDGRVTEEIEIDDMEDELPEEQVKFSIDETDEVSGTEPESDKGWLPIDSGMLEGELAREGVDAHVNGEKDENSRVKRKVMVENLLDERFEIHNPPEGFEYVLDLVSEKARKHKKQPKDDKPAKLKVQRDWNLIIGRTGVQVISIITSLGVLLCVVGALKALLLDQLPLVGLAAGTVAAILTWVNNQVGEK